MFKYSICLTISIVLISNMFNCCLNISCVLFMCVLYISMYVRYHCLCVFRLQPHSHLFSSRQESDKNIIWIVTDIWYECIVYMWIVDYHMKCFPWLYVIVITISRYSYHWPMKYEPLTPTRAPDNQFRKLQNLLNCIRNTSLLNVWGWGRE